MSYSGTEFKLGDYFRLDYPGGLLVGQIIDDSYKNHWKVRMLSDCWWDIIHKYGLVREKMVFVEEKEAEFYELFTD